MCPLGSRTGLQGCFDEAGACRTGVFKCPGDNKGLRMVGIIIYNNSYRTNPCTKGTGGWKGVVGGAFVKKRKRAGTH